MHNTQPQLENQRLRDPKLISDIVRGKMPKLYEMEFQDDPMVWVKYFAPTTGWIWYGIEFDGDDLFFGLVIGSEMEMGYFSLSELDRAYGQLGLPMERDLYFEPQPLSHVKRLHDRRKTIE